MNEQIRNAMDQYGLEGNWYHQHRREIDQISKQQGEDITVAGSILAAQLQEQPPVDQWQAWTQFLHAIGGGNYAAYFGGAE